MLLSSSSRNCPEGPTNGRPCLSSWKPGPSPMKSNLAFAGPSPGTACVRFRRDRILCRWKLRRLSPSTFPRTTSMLYLFLKKLIHAGSQCCVMYQGNRRFATMYQGNHTMVAISQDTHTMVAISRDTHTMVAMFQDTHTMVAMFQDTHTMVAIFQDTHTMVAMFQDTHTMVAISQDTHTIVAISQGNRKGLPLPYAGLISEIVDGRGKACPCPGSPNRDKACPCPGSPIGIRLALALVHQ